MFKHNLIMPRQKCHVSDTNEAPIYAAAYLWRQKSNNA